MASAMPFLFHQFVREDGIPQRHLEGFEEEAAYLSVFWPFRLLIFLI